MKALYLNLMFALFFYNDADTKFKHDLYELAYDSNVWHEERERVTYNKSFDNFQASIRIEVIKDKRVEEVLEAVKEQQAHQLKNGYVISLQLIESRVCQFENIGKGTAIDYNIEIPGFTKSLRERIWLIQSGDDVFKIKTGQSVVHFEEYIEEVYKVLTTIKRV